MNVAGSRNDRLLQVRTEALTAEYIYTVQLRSLTKISSALLLLSIITPLIILIVQYPSKGTAFEPIVQWVSYTSSSILLILAITSIALQIDSKKERFLSARASNTSIANESLELIHNPHQDAAWFFRHVSNQDAIDQKNVENMDKKVKQEAYRESLKRLAPGNGLVKCRVCNLSPYIFNAGDCQLCGNGPQQ
jgi:mobilome CxxCx(11)CxxC protein